MFIMGNGNDLPAHVSSWFHVARPINRPPRAALFMGLVTLAYVSCVTSTIVAAPIKLQYFKNYENRNVYSRNYPNGHENGEHMMATWQVVLLKK